MIIIIVILVKPSKALFPSCSGVERIPKLRPSTNSGGEGASVDCICQLYFLTVFFNCIWSVFVKCISHHLVEKGANTGEEEENSRCCCSWMTSWSLAAGWCCCCCSKAAADADGCCCCYWEAVAVAVGWQCCSAVAAGRDEMRSVNLKHQHIDWQVNGRMQCLWQEWNRSFNQHEPSFNLWGHLI